MSSTPLYQEKELLLLVSQGDEAAFEQLVRYFGPLIKAHALKILQQEMLVQDLVQDVFLRVWLNRNKLPDIENPRAWILQITYYQCFNLLRGQKIRQKASVVMMKGSEPVNVTEEMTAFEEVKRALQAAIYSLPPQTKKIYSLSREQGLRIGEIAQQLNISPQTVKNTLNRALKMIQEYLKEKGIYLPAAVIAFFLY